MKLTRKQFSKTEHFMPIARKPAEISNHQFLCALLYMIENGRNMEGIAEKAWKMALNLYEIQLMVKKRDNAKDFR